MLATTPVLHDFGTASGIVHCRIQKFRTVFDIFHL